MHYLDLLWLLHILSFKIQYLKVISLSLENAFYVVKYVIGFVQIIYIHGKYVCLGLKVDI